MEPVIGRVGDRDQETLVSEPTHQADAAGSSCGQPIVSGSIPDSISNVPERSAAPADTPPASPVPTGRQSHDGSPGTGASNTRDGAEDQGGNTPDRGLGELALKLGFVLLVVAVGAVLALLGLKTAAVVELLVGAGLGAVEMIRRLQR